MNAESGAVMARRLDPTERFIRYSACRLHKACWSPRASRSQRYALLPIERRSHKPRAISVRTCGLAARPHQGCAALPREGSWPNLPSAA